MNNYPNALKLVEKKLISDTNKIKDLKTLIASFIEYETVMLSLKEDIKAKESNEALLENAASKSKILEPLNKFFEEYLESYDEFTKSKTIKEMYEFFEKYRTYRTYQLNENLLERFISGFLNNFAEDYTFKTEFIGQIDLNKFADEVSGIRENSIIKIKYSQIPKVIKESYNARLRKFIIETHNMKLLFRENYLVEIYSNSNMIHKIDKIAKENGIKFQ